MINTTDCIYSKLPPDDEQLISSKHVEDNYWNKLGKKVHLVGCYYANLSFLFVSIKSVHKQPQNYIYSVTNKSTKLIYYTNYLIIQQYAATCFDVFSVSSSGSSTCS